MTLRFKVSLCSLFVPSWTGHLNFQCFPFPSSVESSASSLVAELQEKLQEEKVKFLEQLEEHEKRKNEEMQNIRTSLTAEQQVDEAVSRFQIRYTCEDALK